jgi:hypothetical protein
MISKFHPWLNLSELNAVNTKETISNSLGSNASKLWMSVAKVSSQGMIMVNSKVKTGNMIEKGIQVDRFFSFS